MTFTPEDKVRFFELLERMINVMEGLNADRKALHAQLHQMNNATRAMVEIFINQKEQIDVAWKLRKLLDALIREVPGARHELKAVLEMLPDVEPAYDPIPDEAAAEALSNMAGQEGIVTANQDGTFNWNGGQTDEQ